MAGSRAGHDGGRDRRPALSTLDARPHEKQSGWAFELSRAATRSALMVEAGRSERVRRILDTFSIDDGAVGHEQFKRMYAEEGPVLIELVKQLGPVPE